jgi:hypothetical protein
MQLASSIDSNMLLGVIAIHQAPAEANIKTMAAWQHERMAQVDS